MKYGKLKEGALIYAPGIIQTDDRVIYQPSHKTLIEKGYKLITETPYPEQTDSEMPKVYIPQYVEEADRIVQVWTEAVENLTESEIREGGV